MTTTIEPRSHLFRPTAVALLSLALLPAAGAWSPAQATDGAFLIADLNTGELRGNGVDLGERVEFDHLLFFTARSARFGEELWSSDGTPEGTRMVRDLCPGSCDSDPRGLTVFGGRLYFFASDGVYGTELWSSDGTAGGTRLVRDICPGPCSSGLYYQPAGEVLGGRLYFSAWDGVNGRELWSTDGSRAGTGMVADLCPGRCSSSPEEMLATAAALFFVAYTPAKDFSPISLAPQGFSGAGSLASDGPRSLAKGLWVTDGTAEGTRQLVADCKSYCRPAMTLHRTLFFKHHDSEHGIELWSSDGTVEGTHRFVDLCPGSCSGIQLYGTYFTRGRGELYFTGQDSPQQGYGFLFRTDGTADGTELVLGGSRSSHRHITHVVSFGNHLYFLGEGPTPDLEMRRNLFRSDGTPAGTSLVKDIPTGSQDQLVPAGSRLFFRVDYHQLWATNGTEEGTELLLSLQDAGYALKNITRAGTRAFFAGYTSEAGSELWSSDGTAAGTRLVADVYREMGSSAPVHLTSFGDSVVFAADDDLEVPGVWRSDGTAAGTFALGFGPETSAGFYRDGDILLFSSAESRTPEAGLWSTDATAAGTHRIAPEVGAARHFTPVGDVLFLSAERWDGEELWITDRSEEGTRQVKDICPGIVGVMPPTPPCSSAPHDLHAVGSDVLFAAFDEDFGEELMGSDGTAEGTLVLKDLCEDDCSSSPADIVRFGDRFYFAATDAEVGRELWTTDGTADGTRRLLDLRPGPESSSPHSLTVWNDRIFFFAQSGTNGEELWSSDGTADGTERVRDLAVAALPSFVTESALVDDRLFLVVVNEATGPELWVSRGTEATTGMVREIHPGPIGAYPESLTAVDGVVVFRADDGEHGHELWVSDGTEAGTRLLADAVAGEPSSYPTQLAATADLLFFQADDPTIGRELWALDRALVNPGWVPPADLAVSVVAAPEPVLAGELLTYTVTVANAGPNPAPEVVVTATLGAGASLAATSGCAEDPAGVPTCTLGTIAPGSSRQILLSVEVDPAMTGPLPCTVGVTSAAPDPHPEDNAATATSTVDPGYELRLGGKRFAVRVSWRTVHGTSGRGRAVAHSETTGFFWFFDPENIELLVKVLDGRAINGHYWVFYGALSDVEYQITVTDLETGAERTYFNPQGQLCGQGDVEAFAGEGIAAGASLPHRSVTSEVPAAQNGACDPGADALCLHQGRFRVEVRWKNQHDGGSEGVGQALAGTEETGYFWFFSPDNLELAVKILDGRPLTGKFWVFYGGLSDVEYRITVTDTLTGTSKSYHHPPGEICGGADVNAL